MNEPSQIQLSPEVLAEIDDLPQIRSGEWSRDYLAEQVLRNLLGLSSDYDLGDLTIVFAGEIVE